MDLSTAKKWYHSCTCSTVDVFELKTNKRTGQTCLSYRAFFLRSSYCVWTLWDFPLKKKPLSGVLHGIEIRPVAAVAGTETNCLRPALQVALVMQ